MSATPADQTSPDEAEFVFHRGAEADIQYVFRFEDYPLNRIAVTDMRCIVDIGAHCGAFSYLCAQTYPSAAILAFEPLGINYDLSVRNTARFANVNIKHCGLSDHEGEIKIFYAPDWGYAASSSVKSFNHSDDFEMARLHRASDQLADTEHMSILKIDTEGKGMN